MTFVYTKPLVLAEGPGVLFQLARPFEVIFPWDQETLASDLFPHKAPVSIFIYQGLLTDFASIPRPLWPFFPPHHRKWRKAALIHDALYQVAPFRRLTADRLFYELLLWSKVSKWKAKLFYHAVRIGGRKPYVNYRQRALKNLPPLDAYKGKAPIVTVKQLKLKGG